MRKTKWLRFAQAAGAIRRFREALIAERIELLQKRDALRAELAAATARLAARRGRKPPAEPG